MADINERRKHIRFPVIENISEPVEIHFSPPFFQEPIIGKIVKISAGGIGLIINEPIPKYFIFSLYIRLRGIKSFEVKGKVIRLEKGISQYEVGVLFTEIDEPTVEMLTLLAGNYDGCIKKRSSEDKNYCFEECKFKILCNKENRLITTTDGEKDTSEISIQNIQSTTMKVEKETEEEDLQQIGFSSAAKTPDVKSVIRERSRDNIHPGYYVFLGFVFILIVGLFSKDKITEIIIANAQNKFLVSNYNSAVSNYNIVLKYKPDDINVRLKLAEVYNKMKMYANAEKEYERIVKIKPDMFTALMELGKLNIRFNKVKEAFICIKKANYILPQNTDAKVYLGVCYEKDKNYDEAVNVFKNIPSDLKLEDEVYLSIGKVYGVKGYYKNAILYLSKANLQKTAVEYFEMGIMENEKEQDESIFNFFKAIVRKNDFAQAYEWLGLIYRKKGFYTPAIECYQNALNINPQSARIFFNLAQLYALQDDTSKAISLLGKAVSLDKTYVDLAKNSYEFSEMKNKVEFKKVLKKF
ncbi:MAG: tetratricopeptide repeat protein [Elusimicrobia bacterium]|nr:tetratricopeptide repeat protein [Elusimicrobiota bacterium]